MTPTDIEAIRKRLGEVPEPGAINALVMADIPALLAYVADLEQQVREAKAVAFEEAASIVHDWRPMTMDSCNALVQELCGRVKSLRSASEGGGA